HVHLRAVGPVADASRPDAREAAVVDQAVAVVVLAVAGLRHGVRGRIADRLASHAGGDALRAALPLDTAVHADALVGTETVVDQAVAVVVLAVAGLRGDRRVAEVAGDPLAVHRALRQAQAAAGAGEAVVAGLPHREALVDITV